MEWNHNQSEHTIFHRKHVLLVPHANCDSSLGSRPIVCPFSNRARRVQPPGALASIATGCSIEGVGPIWKSRVSGAAYIQYR